MRWARTPSSSQAASSSSSASGSPERTSEAGPLIAASETRSPKARQALGQLRGRQRDRDHRRPCRRSSPSPCRAGRRPGRRPRARAPPATWAAAISPWEWPTTTAGSTPQSCQSLARETITAKRAGWTTSRRSSQRALLVAQDLAQRPIDERGRAPPRTPRYAAAKAGEDSQQLQRHPGCWAPWPGKRKAGSPLGAGAAADERRVLACPRPGRRGRRAAPRARRRPRRRGARSWRGWWPASRRRRRGRGSGLASRWAARRRPSRAGPARTWPRGASGAGGPDSGACGPPLPASTRLAEPEPRRRRGGRLLQDQVGVGAADAEGGDAGAARAAVRPPSRPARSSSSISPASQSTLEEGAST